MRGSIVKKMSQLNREIAIDVSRAEKRLKAAEQSVQASEKELAEAQEELAEAKKLADKIQISEEELKACSKVGKPRGRQVAKKKEPKEEPKEKKESVEKPTKRAYKKHSKENGELTMVETIIQAMGSKTMSAKEVLTAAEEKGLKLQCNYIGAVLSSSKGGKNAPDAVDEKGKPIAGKKAKIFESVSYGRYRVADWAKSGKGKAEKGPSSPKKAEEGASGEDSSDPQTSEEETPVNVKDLLSEVGVDPSEFITEKPLS